MTIASKLLFAVSVLCIWACQTLPDASELQEDDQAFAAGLFSATVVPVSDRGTEPHAPEALEAVGSSLLSELNALDPATRKALEAHRKLLRRQPTRRTYTFGDRQVSARQLIEVVDQLLTGQFSERLSAVSVSQTPKDVHFTGYYSPIIEVSQAKTETYRYPLLARPKDYDGKLPNRWSIERDSSLHFDTLALAWAAHPLDVYALQLQGSGFVRYRDGNQSYFAYDGTNKYPYQSLELAIARQDSSLTNLSFAGVRRWISEDMDTRDTVTALNPNYGFFRKAEGAPRGAAGVPLTKLVSVAADPKHYPLGSILVATVPNTTQHNGQPQVRLLLVQDTGGAVRGDRRLDLYTGVGKQALRAAERVFDSGEVYALVPRQGV